MKFKVGDKVQIAIPEDQDTEHGRAGVKNKHIGVVILITRHFLRIEWEYGAYVVGGLWNGVPREMKLVEPKTNKDALEYLSGR